MKMIAKIYHENNSICITAQIFLKSIRSEWYTVLYNFGALSNKPIIPFRFEPLAVQGKSFFQGVKFSREESNDNVSK